MLCYTCRYTASEICVLDYVSSLHVLPHSVFRKQFRLDHDVILSLRLVFSSSLIMFGFLVLAPSSLFIPLPCACTVLHLAHKSLTTSSPCLPFFSLPGSIQICPTSSRHWSGSVGQSPASATQNPCRGNVLFLHPFIWNAMLLSTFQFSTPVPYRTGFYTADVFDTKSYFP